MGLKATNVQNVEGKSSLPLLPLVTLLDLLLELWSWTVLYIVTWSQRNKLHIKTKMTRQPIGNVWSVNLWSVLYIVMWSQRLERHFNSFYYAPCKKCPNCNFMICTVYCHHRDFKLHVKKSKGVPLEFTDKKQTGSLPHKYSSCSHCEWSHTRKVWLQFKRQCRKTEACVCTLV